MPTDHFPATLSTDYFRVSGAAAINTHLMSTYRKPLRIYFLGLRKRPPCDADDFINAFFEKRLDEGSKPLIDKWLAYRASTGTPMRLGQWLRNSLCQFVYEFDRPRKFDPRNGAAMPDDVAMPDSGDVAGDEERRASITSFVQRALVDAEAACVTKNSPAHWRAFVAHHLENRPLAGVGDELGVTETRAYRLSKTARGYFVRAFEDVLRRDGADGAEIDLDVAAYLEFCRRKRK